MKKAKIYLFIGLFIGMMPMAKSQTYQLRELEQLFLASNYRAIAAKLRVDAVDAEMVQAKLWNNPTLSVAEVNLWKNQGHEVLPHLFGSYGTAQQIAVELEQMVETAGKRKKRVAVKAQEKQGAVIEYEEVLRQLLFELRTSYYTLGYQLQKRDLLDKSLQYFNTLRNTYDAQAKLKNVSQADFLRVEAQRTNLDKQLLEIDAEIREEVNAMQVLTQLAALSPSQVVFEGNNAFPITLSTTLPANLTEVLVDQNHHIRYVTNETQRANRELILEKAMRKPDVTVQVNYDRGGNIMNDFVGLGLSVDLPVFNRNKGAIQAASIRVQERESEAQLAKLEVERMVSTLRTQLSAYEVKLREWEERYRDANFNQMLDNYQKHLQSRQISLMEFVDFSDAYTEARTAYFELQKEYRLTYEQLQYLFGKDFDDR